MLDSLPATRHARGAGLDAFTERPLPYLTLGQNEISPGSSASPLSACSALRPRCAARHSPFRRARYCLPLCQRRRPTPLEFRGCITRPADSLSTLRSAGRPAPRKTRYRLAGLAFAGRDLHPLGHINEFRRHLLPLVRGFPVAMAPSSRGQGGVGPVDVRVVVVWLGDAALEVIGYRDFRHASEVTRRPRCGTGSSSAGPQPGPP
jgi:hypothetical protein